MDSLCQKLQSSPIELLRKIHLEVLQAIDEMQSAGTRRHQIFEAKFTKALTHLMSRMHKQIEQWKGKCVTFNKDIEKEAKFMRISDEVAFYRDQCVKVKQQLHKLTLQLSAQKEQIATLKREKETLQACLVKRVKKTEKYRSRVLSLTRHRTDSEAEEVCRKRTDTFQLQSQLLWKNSQAMIIPQCHNEQNLLSTEEPTSDPQREKFFSSAVKRTSYSGRRKLNNNKKYLDGEERSVVYNMAIL